MSDEIKKYKLKSGAEKEDKKKERKFTWKKALVFIVIIAVVAVVVRIGFGPAILWADISEYENEKILVTGLTEEDFYITPKDLSKLKLTSVTATGKSQKAGTVNGLGPTMETFLAQYGKKVSDFKQVKFSASDDYTAVLVNSLQEKEVVLSIAKGMKPLEKYQRPLRIVIPNEDSGKWIRLVVKMEFTPK